MLQISVGLHENIALIRSNNEFLQVCRPNESVIQTVTTKQHLQVDALGRPRIMGLDALRGIAAMLVMLMHYGPAYELHRCGHEDRIYVWLTWGGCGVSLFFMISGFVIPMTLDRAKGIGEFAFARWARLFPLFWFSIAFTQLLLWISPVDQERSWAVVMANLTMLPSRLGFPRVSGVFWTLEVELTFYLLIAFIVVARCPSEKSTCDVFVDFGVC